MLKNYFITSFRNLARYRSYSVINIFGLSIGLATAIFTFIWVIDELSYDRFHVNADRIYHVLINNAYPDGRIETYGATPALLKEAIQNEIPEADLITQLSMDADVLLTHQNTSFNEQGIYADENFFFVFSFPVINGNPSNPLPTINSIAISDRVAKKLFAGDNPIGKPVRVGLSNEFLVASVFADVPDNSSLTFDYVLPFERFAKENPWTQHWRSGGTRTFLTLKSGTSVEAADHKLSNLIKKNCDECSTSPFLFPFTKSRLYNEFENGKNAGGRIELVILFCVVAAIILIMACINFMNLATARSATRSREVGVRKVMGAQQHGLITQFMMESVLLSFFALCFALVIVQLLLPNFNSITEKNIHLDFSNPWFLSGTLLITLLYGLLAGSYPAFFLSSFKPAAVLKGNVQSLMAGSGLRKTLIVVQFVASVVLIIGSVVVYQQITFINNKNLGFVKDNIVVIDQHESLIKNHEAFTNELRQFPAVKNVGFGGSNILTIPITTTDPSWPGKSDDSSIPFKIMRCDEGFIPTMGIELLAGRNFSDMNKLDQSNYIINQKAMDLMGLSSENVIGADLEMWQGKGKIIGLTGNFHNGSLREEIEPLIFMYSTTVGFHYYIRIDEKSNRSEALSQIEKTFKKYGPDYPFQYRFLNEEFNQQYRTEATIGKLALNFTIIAVLISCMELFGLASFMAERRVKEIGIRKVMGATVNNLIIMLCNDFAKLVFIGLLIGCPVAWYVASSYLSGYAFHVELSAWILVGTACGTLLIALATVIFQSLKASLANPVDSLRNE